MTDGLIDQKHGVRYSGSLCLLFLQVQGASELSRAGIVSGGGGWLRRAVPGTHINWATVCHGLIAG